MFRKANDEPHGHLIFKRYSNQLLVVTHVHVPTFLFGLIISSYPFLHVQCSANELFKNYTKPIEFCCWTTSVRVHWPQPQHSVSWCYAIGCGAGPGGWLGTQAGRPALSGPSTNNAPAAGPCGNNERSRAAGGLIDSRLGGPAVRAPTL